MAILADGTTMKIIVVIYWAWFAISMIVLTRRAVRRLFRTDRPAAATDPAAPIGAATTPDDVTTAPVQVSDIAARVQARAAQLAAAGSPVAPADAAVAPADGAVAPGDAEMVERPAPRTDDVEVERPTPTAVPGPTRSAAAGARTTLADALAGIKMPSGLAPLMHVEGRDPARRAVFHTSDAPIEILHVAVSAELARLGYELELVGPADALARRGDDLLTVRMHAIGPQPKKGPADTRYPTAPGGSVVLDVELT